MTFKQIETSREIRLWLTEIIIPTAAVVGLALTIPEVRESIGNGFRKTKMFVKSQFKR